MNYPYTKDQRDESKTLKNPLDASADVLERGRKSYTTYCSPCHGTEGLGDGPVAAKYPANYVPTYKGDRIKKLYDGEVYHAITHGFNQMGSYAYALTPEQRWEVIHYVNYLKNKK
jgi:mono/diheme cytochrome c family protein